MMVSQYKKDLDMLKVAISSVRSSDANTQDEAVYQMLQKPFSTEDDFESFNDKLKDRQFYKNVVSILKN